MTITVYGDECRILKPLYNLHTHTSIVIRAFPEAGFIIFPVDRAVFEDTPIPLSLLFINDLFRNNPAGKWLCQDLYHQRNVGRYVR